MKPLETMAKPRSQDVIELAESGSEGARRSALLSAELVAKPSVDTGILFAIDGRGTIFQLTANGAASEIAGPENAIAVQIVVTTKTNEAFILARTKDCGTVPAYAVFRLAESGWVKVIDVPPSQSRPMLGGSACGIWIAQGRTLRLVENGTVIRERPLDFGPTGISEGSEGTLWLMGGSKRYGGLEIRRWDENTSRWFLLPPPAAAISLAAAPDGTAWGVSTKGELWRFSRDGAGTFRECGNDADCRRCFYKPERSFVRSVSMGCDGNVWLLSGQANGLGFVIERMIDLATRETHEPTGGARAVSIAAAVA